MKNVSIAILGLASTAISGAFAVDECGLCFSSAVSTFSEAGASCSSAKEFFSAVDTCLEEECSLTDNAKAAYENAKTQAAEKCQAGDGFDINDYPRLECAACIRKVYDDVADEQPAGSKCDVLENLLVATQRCRESVCDLDTSSFEQNLDDAIKRLTWIAGDDCKVTIDDFPWKKCKRCVATALNGIRTAESDQKCAAAAGAIEALETCNQDACKRDISPLIEGIQEVIDEATADDENCEFTRQDFPGVACHLCVHKALQETRQNNGTAADRCERAERIVDAVNECREEQVCIRDPRPVEWKLGKFVQFLKKTGDCDVTIDDFPILACHRCRTRGMKELLQGVPRNNVCEVAEAAATVMRVCNNGPCKGNGDRLQETLRRLINLAGEDCVLELEDLPISDICKECLADFVQAVTALKDSTDAEKCASVEGLLETLKRCVKTCGVRITKAVLGVPVRMLHRFVKRVDCDAAVVTQVEAFATSNDVDLEEDTGAVAGRFISPIATGVACGVASQMV